MSGWLDPAVRQLEVQGYTTVAATLPLHLLTTRLGKVGGLALLQPSPSQEASGWSLSAEFGLAGFPWHTDGAISSSPPRWIALRALDVSAQTYTDLLSPSPDLRRRLSDEILLARDRAGRARYLPATVGTKRGYRLRWDPRTCTPTSADIAAIIAETSETHRIVWDAGRAVVFDNHRLMHRRPAVAPEEVRVLQRTYIWES